MTVRPAGWMQRAAARNVAIRNAEHALRHARTAEANYASPEGTTDRRIAIQREERTWRAGISGRRRARGN